jgi:transposase
MWPVPQEGEMEAVLRYSEEKKALAFEALQNRNKSVKGIAKGLMVSEATVYRYQRELKEQGKLEW